MPDLHDAEAVMNALRRTVLALRVWAQEAEGTTGISGAQVFVLERLAQEPGQSLTRLAERTLTSKAAVSVVVGRLVDKGLVRRKDSPTDGRSVQLDLTPAGKKALERSSESPASRAIAALKRMPPQELAMFARLFERFTEEMGIGGLEPKLLFDTETGEKLAMKRQSPVGVERTP